MEGFKNRTDNVIRTERRAPLIYIYDKSCYYFALSHLIRYDVTLPVKSYNQRRFKPNKSYQFVLYGHYSHREFLYWTKAPFSDVMAIH